MHFIGEGLFFILAGSFNLLVNGSMRGVRRSGVHVGEQVSLDPSKPRSATLVAREASLVLRLAEADVRALTDNNLQFWRRAAQTLGERLEERNSKIGHTNESPRVFVISSSEGLHVAERIATLLERKDIAVDVWDQGTFGISDYPISSLMDIIQAADFTISVVRSDDTIVSREHAHNVSRDNVNLEYGISLGILGRRRSILMVCTDAKVKLPSDLAGLTTVRYKDGNADQLTRSVRNACIEIHDHIVQEGVFQERQAS